MRLFHRNLARIEGLGTGAIRSLSPVLCVARVWRVPRS